MKKIILFFFVALFAKLSFAQDSMHHAKLSHRVFAGINIGAMSPIPLPANIRKVKSYSPLFCPSVGYEGQYRIDKKWSVGVIAALDYKGMKVSDSVLYFHTLVQVGSGAQSSSFEGSFTGTNNTNAKNLYLGVPIFAIFKPNRHWELKLGPYIAFLLDSKFEGTVSDGHIRNGGPTGEKVEITTASFDFADKLRKVDYGIFGGAGYHLSKRFSANAHMQWGLRPTFPGDFTGISFKMYNIFLQLGASYKL